VGETAFPGLVTDSGDLVVLAVQRKGEELAGETVLTIGDTLLLQGTWGALEEQLADPEVLVVDEPAVVRRQVPLGPGAKPGARYPGRDRRPARDRRRSARGRRTARGWAIVVGRVLTIEQAYRGISWTTVVLVAGMIPLSTSMTDTGAAAKLADVLVDIVGGSGPYAPCSASSC
jgi:di/tricarboxylate transporter